MSTGYSHLSKAGARIINKLNDTPKHLLARNEKFAKLSIPDFLKPDIKEVKDEEKFQTVKQWKFMPGDRVVIMKGSNRGNICFVKQHDITTNGFILDEQGPTKSVPVPKQFWMEGQKTHMISVPVATKQEDLRLVADIDDPSNPGQTKIVAVRDIEFKGTYYDENYKKMMPYRSVLGQDELIIPWPKPEAQEEGELATEPSMAREQTFWVESIKKNPIPRQALPTIRNPHSKFRRGNLTARDISKLVAPEMPLSEAKRAYLRERKQLAESPRPQLTDEEMQKIGEKVYEHLKTQL